MLAVVHVAVVLFGALSVTIVAILFVILFPFSECTFIYQNSSNMLFPWNYLYYSVLLQPCDTQSVTAFSFSIIIISLSAINASLSFSNASIITCIMHVNNLIFVMCFVLVSCT